MSYFKIDGNTIPEPAKFEIANKKIDNRDRLSSGKMVIDEITTKRVFNLNYTMMKNSDVTLLRNAFVKTGSFFTFTFRHDGSTKTATVVMSDFTESLLYETTATTDWMYRDLPITLEEQ